MLSYDEIFKKWQKSGESKTPGGVKIGVFRFIAVLLFCISTSPLWAADLNSAFIPCPCATFNSSDSDAGNCFSSNGLLASDKYRLDWIIGVTGDENRCKAVAGCKYTNECETGASGYYTDYTTGGQDYTPQRCPEGFPESAAGSWNQNQCYYTTNCAGVNQHSASTDTPHTCRVYYGGKVVCKNSNTQPTCQGAWGTSSHSNGICNLNQASLEGVDYNDGNLEYTYHIEGSGNNAKCYFNTRNCNLFNEKYKATDSNYARGSTEATTNIECEECSIARTVRGDATWDGNKWIVSGCYAERNANDIIVKYGNSNEQNAYCSGVILSKQENANNSVNDANVAIYYNYGNYYLCTECNAGYVVANNAYATDSNIACYTTGSSYTGNSGVYVCKCDPVDRGYYLSSQVQICNYNSSQFYSSCKKTLDQLNNLINPSNKRPCGPGQTTNEGGGAASEDDCHYTIQTRFCDAHGCFYLSDLGWDATNHTYNWNGETNTGQ